MKLFRTMAATALLVFYVPLQPAAQAPPPDVALRVCASMENDLDRLACYDRVSGRTPEQTSAKTAPGSWRVTEETSKLTDERNVFMSVVSEEVIDCGWNRGENIFLFIRCFENTTSLYFTTGCHMASSRYDNYGDITYRADEDPARTVKGDASTNNRSLGLWRGGQSIPVIKSLFGKKSLIARMTPYAENPFTATFDIRGLEQQIAPLRSACSW